MEEEEEEEQEEESILVGKSMEGTGMGARRPMWSASPTSLASSSVSADQAGTGR
jgi:hypothetical protein